MCPVEMRDSVHQKAWGNVSTAAVFMVTHSGNNSQVQRQQKGKRTVMCPHSETLHGKKKGTMYGQYNRRVASRAVPSKDSLKSDEEADSAKEPQNEFSEVQGPPGTQESGGGRARRAQVVRSQKVREEAAVLMALVPACSMGDGRGFAFPEQIISSWAQEGVHNGREVLQVAAGLAAAPAEPRRGQFMRLPPPHNTATRLSVRCLEQGYRGRVILLWSEVEVERSKFWERAKRQRARLEEDLRHLQAEETSLCKKLTLTLKPQREPVAQPKRTCPVFSRRVQPSSAAVWAAGWGRACLLIVSCVCGHHLPGFPVITLKKNRVGKAF
ncbi:unnamed protein product [Rangifer tarandus platyrhynchus]|uniref:Uncharacterized protein n=1 Tax=Rangifer tarandus platyrhynchus TaxID=3082113 RepID=A0ABN8XWR0_RANTA|nr:unnamed protein product [Rangifer tarandus platyrhynchus]